MDLLEIIIHYLNLPKKKAEMFLTEMVENCGMDRNLVSHIQGCRKRGKWGRRGMGRQGIYIAS